MFSNYTKKSGNTVIFNPCSYEKFYFLHFLKGPILSTEILGDMFDILTDSTMPEAQRHAAGTIRNLSVGNHIRVCNFLCIYMYIYFMPPPTTLRGGGGI